MVSYWLVRIVETNMWYASKLEKPFISAGSRSSSGKSQIDAMRIMCMYAAHIVEMKYRTSLLQVVRKIGRDTKQLIENVNYCIEDA